MKKLVALSFALLFVYAGCGPKGTHKVETLKSGTRIMDDTVGTGTVAKMGDVVTVDFTGWIVRDTADLFGNWNNDSTKKSWIIGTTKMRHKPYKFVLEPHAFITGSAEGIVGMKVGGTRTIIIPDSVVFAGKKRRPVPANTSLKVQVELRASNVAPKTSAWSYDKSKVKTTKDGLKYVIIKEGTGPKAKAGQTVTVNYTGFLEDGKKFDSSVERDEPFSFKLGAHQVIPGWDEGISFLNKGAKAVFIIPPALAYGNRGNGPIPPNSTLIFDVELLNIK